ncbi:prolipoprotein diacylglyceryl transferase [Sulfurovum sp. XGS-02]|uniref:prolipoprotein diacylglyceryl transferase n=1 Tax=Sulfurovum sp. XGS-02 TaxID=2925411 RepID=UPI0020611D1C|nr:prolipoprotein diacylglyceryl transferase [Sulfurovum sp. XGS-02]UPT77291.1 prolipoprotein diacylglyceryl transferase [Sulfurovum sp. XGS-02]
MEHFIWNVNPNILELGPLQLRWYGLLFVGSFFLGLMILTKIYKREGKDPAVLDAMLIYIMVGAVLGSRLVHCFFYEPEFYLSRPLEILKVWKGGLASHGGLAGVLIALYLFAKRYHTPYMWLLSRVSIPGALTAAFVRFGNLFNSEILGLPSDKPWAIIFARVDMIPRHPVQLYEAFSYLIILLLLVTVYRKVTPSFATKILPSLFLVTVFTARFFLEYTKTRQAAYTTELPFTTGQMLSIPYIILGILWMIWAFKSVSKDQKYDKASHS